ncbi:MAG TPA: phosphoglycerate dehydrogenase [bacterium]|jgi:D-3-phosphoglycerate dehydrogenase|nr:phosphoglycerate dehydrogenase [bacterium]
MAHFRVLISAPHLLGSLQRFRPLLEANGVEAVVPVTQERLDEAALLPLVTDIDGVICGDDAFTARVLAAAPNLKVISKWGVGIDAIDLEAAAGRGIVVRNTPAALADPVADTVLAYVLCFARQVPWLDRNMKAGRWERLPARALRECSLGVIGLGSIGRAVVRRAAAFGMKVLGCDIVPPDPAYVSETSLTVLALDDVLAHSDFVSLNTTLTPQTVHLIGAREVGLMRANAVLINTARGGLVDEPALIDALRSGRLGGAALDVFEVEPLPPDSPLRGMDHVLLGPHAANASPAAFERIHELAIANLLEELSRWKPG